MTKGSSGFQKLVNYKRSRIGIIYIRSNSSALLLYQSGFMISTQVKIQNAMARQFMIRLKILKAAMKLNEIYFLLFSSFLTSDSAQFACYKIWNFKIGGTACQSTWFLTMVLVHPCMMILSQFTITNLGLIFLISDSETSS